MTTGPLHILAAFWDEFQFGQWISDHKLILLLSVGTFVVSIVAVPLIIARLPKDYFLRGERPITEEVQEDHPIIRWLFLIGKNLLGAVLVLGGIAMLVLPGQGVLTILIGLMLLDFPGKRNVERWILRQTAVEKVVNWIRKKRGREPLLFPDSEPPNQEQAEKN